MGLLDALNPEARAGLMMMAAAGPTAQPMNFGQRMAGLLSTMDAQKAAEEDRKMRQQQMQLQQQHLQAQIAETQAQAQQRAAAVQAAQQQAQEQKRIRGLVSGAFSPVSPVQANAASGVTGPRPQALDVVGTRPQVDYQGLIAQGVPPELVAKLAESRNYGRDKVARTVEVMGTNGPETVQVDEFGNRVGQGFAKPFELKMQDLGGKVVPLNPYTGAQQGGGMGKTMTPGEVASNSLGWANNALSRQRLEMDKGDQAKPVWDAERGILVNPRTGVAVPAMLNGQPVGAKDKGLNDSQSKALLFGSRMQEADRVLGGLAKAGVDRPGQWKTGAETVGKVLGLGTESMGGALSNMMGSAFNITQSSNQQKVEQAQRDFINAVLRRESGAAISPGEFDSARTQYFPQMGDSEEVKAQKARNRALATQGMLAEVPDGKRLPGTAPATPSAAGKPSIDELLKKYGG